jgi:predicted TIM-barrel fold metal-dependent hydrolase
MRIFDCHTHFFSRTFFETQAAQVPGADVPRLLEELEAKGMEVPGDDASHRERILADLDRNGVARAVCFASVPQEMKAVAEAAYESDGRLVPYAVVDPRDVATVERFDTLQPHYAFQGLMLFPAMHDFGIGDEVAEAALNLAYEHGLTVFVHCGLLRVKVRHLLGLNGDYPLDHADPRDLLPVARERSDQTFVVPHFGAGLFEEFLELGGACPNVLADTAGSNNWAARHDPPLTLADLFARTKEVFGADRILFGSDSGSFPRGYRRDVLEAQIQAMDEAGFSEEEKTKVMGGNLDRLLGD